MNIYEYRQAVGLDKENQAQKALLLCYYHYRKSDEQIFDMKGIKTLFSDAGYNENINTGRVKRNLINQNLMRAPKGMMTSLEFVPAVLEELEIKYSKLWEDNETISSGSELIDENLFCGKRQCLDKLIRQINHCYANNCYDAVSVLMRRQFEVLLVSSYIYLKIDNEIKEPTGNCYKTLAKIVDNAKGNDTLKLSRIKNKFDDFRDLGNASAHNIYFTTQQSDIDKLSFDYRKMLEELYNKAGLME